MTLDWALRSLLAMAAMGIVRLDCDENIQQDAAREIVENRGTVQDDFREGCLWDWQVRFLRMFKRLVWNGRN